MEKASETVKRVAFTIPTERRLTVTLNQIAHVRNIGWEFTDDALTVEGFDGDEPITFTHHRAAEAFLDAWLMGYNVGYGDARAEHFESRVD